MYVYVSIHPYLQACTRCLHVQKLVGREIMPILDLNTSKSVYVHSIFLTFTCVTDKTMS
jgi:hypothetical protein